MKLSFALVERQEARMLDDEKLLIYFDNEEHLIRRLGSAVVSCWSAIPRELQDSLIARAQRIADDEEPEHLGSDLEAFLHAHLSRIEERHYP